MIIKEYRITMPISVDEYKIGQLYAVAEASRNETGGGDGVEILLNEPFENNPLMGNQFSAGQYTKKKYYMANKIGPLIRAFMPKSALLLEENAWNAYPYCRTILTNDYMKQDFTLTIESLHLADRGEQENVHRLSREDLAKREVVRIDIAADPPEASDYKSTEDPKTFESSRTGRGLLSGNWSRTCDPVMTCYKLVTCEFKWFGFQKRVEGIIHRYEKRLFSNFHRQLFCWIDRWYELTMDDIRQIEEDTRRELERQRASGQARGTSATD